jgi:hypothetical protein
VPKTGTVVVIDHRLQREVGHGPDEVKRRPEPAQRRKIHLGLFLAADVDRDQEYGFAALKLGGERFMGGNHDQDLVDRELIRRVLHQLPAGAQHLSCAFEREGEHAGVDERADRVQLELELGDEAECLRAAGLEAR